MIHIRAVREDFANTTICGIPLHRAGYTMSFAAATDEPMPRPVVAPGQDDLRCPECWGVWRAERAMGFDPYKERRR